MPATTKLRCPKCGAEMNRHAEKLVYSDSAAEAGRIDSALGGLIEETHACPRCGDVESRRL
jgi:predicted RNA-binding Zn-ribbon protein involved in translation (DUF1610 family)